MDESKHIQLNEAKWDKWAESIDGKGFKYEYLRRAQNTLISILDIRENVHMLDIGCGTGRALGQAAKLANGKGLFYGVDLSAKMIEKAKENFKEGGNFHFVKSSSESIPLRNDLFEIIISTNSFHHYLNPGKAMNEIYRLLKPGGKVYILDPTADLLIVKIANKIIKLFEPGHVKLYSTQEFKNFITGAGLKYAGCEAMHSTIKIHIGEK
jgi:ubiquinone/menaquinone biosynthesis C-methylase UbiE